MRSMEKVEGIERETSRREKSAEANHEASKRDIDDDWNGKGEYS